MTRAVAAASVVKGFGSSSSMSRNLLHGDSKVSEKSDGKRKMSAAVNWSEMIGVIAGPKLPGDTGESWLARAARRAGITYRQAKALRYGETTDPKHSVASRVLSAADQAKIELARHHVNELASIIQSLRNVDEDFHRPQIDGLVSAARALGAVDRSGD